MRRGLVALILGILWFTFGGPAAVRALDGVGSSARGQRSATDLRRMLDVGQLPPSAVAKVEEAERLARRETAWSTLVASLLTDEERSQALALAAAAPPVLASPGMTLEPEIPVLVDAILRRYGPATAPSPEVPKLDKWTVIDRRTRARALAAIVAGPGLDADRAAVLLGATLELMHVQEQRSAIEAELAEM